MKPKFNDDVGIRHGEKWGVDEKAEKFTPKPWIPAPNKAGGTSIFTESHRAIAIIPDDPGTDDSEFNAALIAAAPTMYDKLAFLEKELSLHDSTCGLVDDIEQILAKARGEY